MKQICAALLLSAALCLAGNATADEDEQAETDSVDARMEAWLVHPQRTAYAVRAATPPEIDGNVDDAVWATAPVQSDFTQNDPDHGEPATQETAFQILYDDEALYIAAICYDSHPDSITVALARRDDWRERDSFEINLDPHHDHQTAMFFTVGPSGWIQDGTVFNDEDGDDTWDGVWEARTARRPDGWSLEMRIPYHVLRFGEKPVYTWGINAFRYISRRAEWTHWSFSPVVSTAGSRATATSRVSRVSSPGAVSKSFPSLSGARR